MLGSIAVRATRMLVALGVAVSGLGFLADEARALEALDGRIQVHGYGEMQIRALDEKFSQQLDLAQWYNVVNLEFEFDILPDGWGPVDLLQAYVRVEGRYDCVWKRGCGMFKSVNTYGDRARRLPDRLTDGESQDYTGVLQIGPNTRDNPNNRVQNLDGDRVKGTGLTGNNGGPVNGDAVEDRGAFGFAGLRSFQGPDDIPDTPDDPFKYTMSPVLDYAFTSIRRRGPEGGGGQKVVLGPWLPKNFITANAVLRTKANPFRGRTTAPFLAGVGGFTRYHTADPIVNGIGTPSLFDLVNPFFANPDTFPAELIEFLPPNHVINPFDPFGPLVGGLVIPGTQTFGTFLLSDPGLQQPTPAILTEQSDVFSNKGANPFGGDYSGISSCTPVGTLPFSEQLASPGGRQPGCLPATNVRVVGGTGELPLRPAPDKSNLDPVFDPTVAQGLYVPSAGLIKYFERGDFDSLDMNFDETDRSFNHGASQQDTKELKEAYVDAEWLDSRLWTRIGLQNIVWGKTELFRTTDQFNPQDLALASLPSLEESRIALMSARFVYSLYEVGPFEDVRLELAANFDEIQPSDLGACGEPYTIDLVCALTAGTFAHGIFGLGVAGVNRPSDPWKDLGGLEVGARIEWRWGRFSFALTDFYGFDDLPTVESLITFERNVDVETGRPLVTRFNPGNPRGNCDNALVTDPRDLYSQTVEGIGTDPDCLKAGSPLVGGSPENALENHHANQQIFAWACSTTFGLASALDPGACAVTLFGSPEILNDNVPVPFSEVISVLSAGEYRANNILGVIADAVNGETGGLPVLPTPTTGINRDANDGIIGAISGSNMLCANSTRAPGCNNLVTNSFVNQGPIGGNVLAKLLPSAQDWITLDSGLTNEQRALLGCGPFYGTRCDSSASLSLLDCNAFTNPGCAVNLPTRLFFFNTVLPASTSRGGGLDPLNLEGSALVQSFPGVEGTPDDYLTTSRAIAPGTVNFEGGPVCTRFVPGESELQKLPGCRGIDSYEVTATQVLFTFEEGYDPRIDGCLVAPFIGTHEVRTFDSEGNDITDSPEMVSCFGNAPLATGDFRSAPAQGGGPALSTIRPCDAQITAAMPDPNDPTCQAQIAEFLVKNNSDSARGNYNNNSNVRILSASTMYHPLAGCLTDDEIALQLATFGGTKGARCNHAPLIPGLLVSPIRFQGDAAFLTPAIQAPRNFDNEFLISGGDCSTDTPECAQIFKNELAVVSWNYAMFLVNGSGCDEQVDVDEDIGCFNSVFPFNTERCSWNRPQLCSAVQGFLGLAGVQRNVLRAGGDGTYGRRTLLWHSGQEVVLNYEKRNVFGFSMDFSEDHTKSSWGVEFTWFESIPLFDNNEFDNIHHVDTYNVTISADRPTFINFLNANRTFFFNTQWFLQYIAGHRSGMPSNGPFNALFTFAIITGYFQDRLNPSLITIYDFNSRSGGVLPSIGYRFTEAFSASVGMALFFGHTQLSDMPINPLGPASNRAGPNAYKDPSDRFISAIRHRDEVWLRLRWTF